MITGSNFLLIVPDALALSIAEEICWGSIFLKSYAPQSTHMSKTHFPDVSLSKASKRKGEINFSDACYLDQAMTISKNY